MFLFGHPLLWRGRMSRLGLFDEDGDGCSFREVRATLEHDHAVMDFAV
jgi:hypothetical protein